jgi:putative colanic acid biosynthesis UDP-glucose lipid carrier transferase
MEGDLNMLCSVIWMLLDAAWLAVGALCAHLLTSGADVPWQAWEIAVASLGSAGQVLGFLLSGLYSPRHHPGWRTVPAWVVAIALITVVAILQLLIALNVQSPNMLLWLDTWFALSLALMVASRLALARWLRRGAPRRRVVIAGQARHLSRWSQATEHDEYRVVAAACLDGTEEECAALAGIPPVGDIAALTRLARERGFDELWLALPMAEKDAIQAYVVAMQHHFVNIRLVAEAQQLPLFNPAATTIGDAAFIDLVTSPRPDGTFWLKPLFDRLFAVAVLLCLSPLLLVLGMAVKLSSPGPVFFRQRRLGVDGREFTILKFRSMRVHAEQAGTITQASKHDARVTAVGRLLRRTSLDELPQFINVLLGQMSVVGPRPHALEHDDLYMRLIDGYMYRYGNPLYEKGGLVTTPQARKGFADYVYWLATQLKGQVRYYEIWNEWNIGTGSTAHPRVAGSVGDYAALVKAAAAAIRRADPAAKIVAGGATNTDTAWFEAFGASGALDAIDGVSIHPYDYGKPFGLHTPEAAMAWVSLVQRRLTAANGGRPVTMYVTEIGWPAHRRGYRPEVVADYLTRFLRLARSDPHVAGVWWYDLVNDGSDPDSREDRFGLFDETFRPLPALHALKAFLDHPQP